MKARLVILATLVALLAAMVPQAVAAANGSSSVVGLDGRRHPVPTFDYRHGQVAWPGGGYRPVIVRRDGHDLFAFVIGAILGAAIESGQRGRYPSPPPTYCPTPPYDGYNYYPSPATYPTYSPPVQPAPQVIIVQAPAPPAPTPAPTIIYADGTAQSIQTVTGTVTLVFATRKPCLIDIPAGKSLTTSENAAGNRILFVRNGWLVGEFKVLAISGQTVTLTLVFGQEPVDGDGFALPATP